ncbi:MAG: restriction endonuclease subunit S [Elusimicrobia bacterium]|nr:restriction endonuclease subunit S [Elusimicrobiota bacterium]
MKISGKRKLRTLLLLADSGTWGNEGNGPEAAPVLRSNNIQNYSLDFTDVAYRIIPKKDKERRRLVGGDILVTKSSGSPDLIGKCCLFVDPKDSKQYYFSNFTTRLRANPKEADPRWIFYWLSSDIGRKTLCGMNSTTSGLRNLNMNLYLDQEILALSVPEQRRIATILDKADAIRRKRQEIIEQTQTLTQAIFLNMFGDPATNPKHWPVDRLGKITEINPRLNLCNANILKPKTIVSFVPMSGINETRGVIALSEPKQYQEVCKGYTPFQDGDVLFAKITPCMQNGKAAIASNLIGGVGFGSTEFHVLRPSQLAISEYLFSFVRHPTFRKEAELSFTGTAGQQRVPKSFLENYRCPRPPVELQREFSTRVAKVWALEEKQTKNLEQANDLMSSLAGQAFKGNPR